MSQPSGENVILALLVAWSLCAVPLLLMPYRTRKLSLLGIFLFTTWLVVAMGLVGAWLRLPR